MIASIDGLVAQVTADSLVLQAGGVGYRIFAGPATISSAQAGDRLKLHTHHLVREDSQALYGFRSTDELGFFELLMTVTGVGPKVALALVSSRPVADLQLAILQGDEQILIAVSGVGRRLAARIVLELREKVAAAGGAAAGLGGAPGVAGETGLTDVGAALQALGYSSGEAREAARGAVGSLPPGASLEERVKAALRVLRRD